MGKNGKILAVCTSEKKGTAKQNVEEGLLIKEFGLSGDAHAGSGRQVSLLFSDSISRFTEKTGMTPEPGAFGENLLIEGLSVADCPVGTCLRCGEALLEVTQIGKECHTDCEIRQRTGDCIMPREGVFARVREGGHIKVGDKVSLWKSRPFTAYVLTVSDRAFYGGYEDRSGPAACEIAEREGFIVSGRAVVPDEEEAIYRELVRIADKEAPDLILTTGGTGFALRDRTPEATHRAGEREAPGIAEALRAESMKVTPHAMLSRAASVIRGRTLIVNLPGSPKAVRECLSFLLPNIGHGLALLRGEADG